MKRALVIIGPTAVGKTAFAFKISKKIPSVLISGDCVQVFRGTDIISGKDLPKDSKFIEDHFIIDSIPIYLVDVVSPTQNFSIYDFLKKTESLVRKAFSEKKIPIIVGGTRFYIDALTTKIETLFIPPNERLRNELKNRTVEELQKKLKEVNPKRFTKMNSSDMENPRRLIRAIEISKFQGPTLSASVVQKSSNRTGPLFGQDEVLVIGLYASFEFIKKKIDARLKKRIKQGALEEAKKLFEQYVKLSDQIKNTNGLKQLFEYLKGEIGFDVAIEHWRISEYNLAKKQLKWLKEKRHLVVFDVAEEGFEEKIFNLIKQNFPNYLLG